MSHTTYSDKNALLTWISDGNQIQGETFTSLNQTGEGFLLELKGEGNPTFTFLDTPKTFQSVQTIVCCRIHPR